MSRPLLPVVAIALSLVAACQSERPNPGASGAAPPTATTPEGPPGGPTPGSCTKPAPGCPCATEGERIPCDEVYSQVGEQVVCGSGEAVCEDGRYGACVINGNIRVGIVDKGLKPLTLGGPQNCNNACDPNCTTFFDDPSGLGDPANGIVEEPGGLTLPGEEGLTAAPCTGGVSGTCAHSICAVGAKLSPGCDATKPNEPSCVSAICAQAPQCCSGAWDTSCTALLDTVCSVQCYASNNGTCFACYNDGFDHDGDGFSGQQGDCLDCDARVNPGAYDYPSNGLDENCDGVVDNEIETCDNGLSLTSSNGFDHARAIDLCKTTTASAQGPNRTWGVISAQLVRATGTSLPHSRGYAIQQQFGHNNHPKRGTRMAVYSSGTARTPGQSGYVNPNGQYGSYDGGTAVSYPPGFPKNASGCPASGSQAYDSAGLRMTIRVPTNAKSFSYNFGFFSSEYPEWVCTAYNDHFVALLTGSSALPANPPQNSNNISFDANGNPVSVNIGFFQEPGCPTCTSSVLSGTGFDGTCQWQSCGGATGWLYTTAPVVGGEHITIQFSVWDQGDHVWDSTLLVDNWRWSVDPSNIETGVEPPGPPPITYTTGTFVRDYDATGVCPEGKSIRWGHWSWQTSTPSDSRVEFSIATATTAAGLDAAPVDPLRFSNPPGPTALAGQPAVANTTTPNTEHGAAVVDTSLVGASRARNLPHLRVISKLEPSTDALAAPTLAAWNLQLTCVDDQ